MNYLKPAVLLTAISITSGCASIKSVFSDEVNVSKPKASTTKMVVPEHLNQPVKSEEYALPAGSGKADNGLKVTSPSSILEILPGSWIDGEDSNPYKIMLEKPEKIEDFSGFLDKGVNGLFTEQGYKKINVTDDAIQISIIKTATKGILFWEKEVDTERFTFNFYKKLADHGRSASISVKPISLEVLNKKLAPKMSSQYRIQQLAIEAINQYSLELDYLYRVAMKKHQSSTDMSLSLDENDAGEFTIRSQRDSNVLFKELDDVLNALGFSIEEEDKTLFSYELTYDKNSPSMWNSLFGSDYANKLDLPKGEYNVILITNVDGVRIVFTNSQGEALDSATLKQLFDLMVQIANEDELRL